MNNIDENQEDREETVDDVVASEVTAEGVDMEDDIETLKQRLAAAEAKAAENWDLVLRTKAEMENLRRRNERDLGNAHKYGMERFATELLPIKDSLELGLDAARDENADVAKLREGTELTLKMFLSAFEKFGISEVHPMGEQFDPQYHQAMTLIEHHEKAPNTVIDVMQKGYTLNERLIRPAMVVVSKAPAEEVGKDEDSTSKIDEKA